jgi:hypothetical protein
MTLVLKAIQLCMPATSHYAEQMQMDMHPAIQAPNNMQHTTYITIFCIYQRPAGPFHLRRL